ncbi:MAG TPA: hypothetical protein VJP86_07535 [Vicinamibacterales bacterium]|jgi:hypothetical protein|nr:hypothetical protein [Vicinamibacterales bacterium]
MRRTLPTGLLLAIACAAGGCTISKTENPLTPTVAGPLPGVNITAPNPVQPRDGQRILNEQQPITLMLNNAASNSVRPFSYLIEVATDAGFANKVFTQDGIAPDPTGRTNFKLPMNLVSGRAYWWRAKAKDGANEGAYSPSANFEVVVPVVFQAPVLIAPADNSQVPTLRPTFSWNNSLRAGGSAIGFVAYDVEISEDPAFLVKLAGTVNEQAGATTSSGPPEDVKVSRRYYWRVRAKDLIVQGPWSATQSFTTPATAGGGTATPVGNGCHIAAGAPTADRATEVIFGCGNEFPSLMAAFPTTEAAEAAAEELLRRTIWHLQVAGFQSARQRNPSSQISKDKLNIVIGGAWHTYDIYSLGTAGNPTRITGLNEVFPADPVPDTGIPD